MTIADVPQNFAISIFLAGVFAGVIATVIFIKLSGPSSRGGGGRDQTPHEIIMAIKKRASGGRPISFFGAVGMFLLIIFLFIFVLGIMSIGRYFTEGKPNGEEFIPYFMRIFVFPLMERFPQLFGGQ